MYSLRKICFFSFFAVALMLGVVIMFSIGQYRLNGQYRQIVKESERAIFEFNTVREQMVESLIKRDFQRVANIADSLNDVNSTLVEILENSLIPPQYKLDMANQVDLTAMVILARSLVNVQNKTESSLRLQSQMRKLAEYFMRFDRVIVGQIKSKIVHFQAVVIGSLGVMLSLLIFSLLLLYRRMVMPINLLVEQVDSKSGFKEGFFSVTRGSVEIRKISDAMNELVVEGRETKGDSGFSPNGGQENDERFAGVMNSITNLLNGIINYAQLLEDLYEKKINKNEERKMIQNIISYAERISIILSKS